MADYGDAKVQFYLGDKIQPHSPSVLFLAEADAWSWLATAGPSGGPQKELIVTVQIVPQIRIVDPEASEDAIQDLTAVVMACLEANLQFNVSAEASDGTQLSWRVYDSLILNGLNVSYRYRFEKSFRASQILWQGKIDYLSPVLPDDVPSFSSQVTQADLDA
jgi:hypothetical protein